MMVGDDDEAKIFTNKKRHLPTVPGMYHGPNSWGDGTGLGCSIVLYCMTTYVRTLYVHDGE